MLTMTEIVERAHKMGREAAELGGSRAPALNDEFMSMMRESMVTDWTLALQEYVRGFESWTPTSDRDG